MLDIGAHMLVMMDVGKGGLSGVLSLIEFGFEVTAGEYALDYELGCHCCFF